MSPKSPKSTKPNPPRTPPPKHIHGINTPYSPGMLDISSPKPAPPPSSPPPSALPPSSPPNTTISRPPPPNTSSPYPPGTTAYLAAEWSRIEIEDTLQDLAYLIPASIMARHIDRAEQRPYAKSIAAAAGEYIKTLLREREEAQRRLLELVWGQGEKEDAKRVLGVVFGEEAAEGGSAGVEQDGGAGGRGE